MIFVTVGTTLCFDELIEKVDNLVASGFILKPVICQIGNGAYLPNHCEYFRFNPNINEWIRKSSLVIGHGGTGTVLTLLEEKKVFIAVANSRGADDHQSQFLKQLSKQVSFLWTNNVDELPALIIKAKTFKTQLLITERLVDDLKKYLNSLIS